MFALLGGEVVLSMGVQGEGHVVPGGMVLGDLLGDGAVQFLRPGEAQGAVYKIVLIVDDKKQAFHKPPPKK